MLRSLSLALSIVASLVGCSTPGAFFGAVDGPAFVAHPSADASHATVYPVSYTHLTLPTNRKVSHLGGPATLKN